VEESLQRPLEAFVIIMCRKCGNGFFVQSGDCAVCPNPECSERTKMYRVRLEVIEMVETKQ